MLEPTMVDGADQRDDAPADRLRRLTADEYARLGTAGWYRDERVELVHGLVVAMSPQGGAHATISARIGGMLWRSLDRGFEVRQHSPLRVGTDSVPEPDLEVVPAPGRFEHPAHALLVVEVSDSSLEYDRTVKLGLYATAGVPEYWIVDVAAEVVEVWTQPRGRVYTVHEVVGRSGTLQPAVLPTVVIVVDDVFRQVG